MIRPHLSTTIHFPYTQHSALTFPTLTNTTEATTSIEEVSRTSVVPAAGILSTSECVYQHRSITLVANSQAVYAVHYAQSFGDLLSNPSLYAAQTLSKLERLPITLPPQAEIINIFAFTRQTKQLIVCIAFAIPSNRNKSDASHDHYYLHVYGNRSEPLATFDTIAIDCQVIKLKYVPFFIATSTLWSTTYDILLSGSDRNIHAFRLNPENQYAEIPLDSSEHPLPFLLDLPSAALSISIASSGDEDFIVVGCQDGLIRLIIHQPPYKPIEAFQPNSDNKPSIHVNDQFFDGPISAVCLFSSTGVDKEQVSQTNSSPDICLAIANATGYAMLYSNWKSETRTFTRSNMLPHSFLFDSPLCIRSIDIDGDGRNEILIGFYSGILGIWKERGVMGNSNPQING